nr:pyridoxal-phosphate dependent enzyme [Actinomycetales bacterium]
MAVYLDPVDHTEYPLEEPRWRSASHRPLWIDPGPGMARAEIDSAEGSLWRYRAALPVEFADPISLEEGRTPLLEKEWTGLGSVSFKLDFLNPTGSFKDRGSSVMLSYLRDRGIAHVLEDSSGNGGSSVAGYGAAGGMRVRIFAPATTSPAKIAQVRAYGAEVELVEGPRVESQNAAIRQSGGEAFYASHNWQPFFLQGTKTLAYELWEDLGFRAPDNVIVPVGAGSSLLGCWLGFRELLTAGQITRMPRLFASQPLNCSPVDASFRAGTDQPVERQVAPTVAEGTAIARPLRLPQMIAALRESHGGTVAVPEQEIVRALDTACSSGLFIEPTSASAVAALTTLASTGVIDSAEETVVLLSGSGLKAPTTVAELIAEARR